MPQKPFKTERAAPGAVTAGAGKPNEGRIGLAVKWIM